MCQQTSGDFQTPAVLNFFHLALSLCRQDLQERFAGSILGSLWVFLWPLVQLFIYIVIFGKLMGARLGMNMHAWSYGFYIAAGLLAWTLFANSLSRCSRCLIDRHNIIRKVKVDLAVFPAAVCLAELLPFAAGFLLLFAADLFTGWAPDPGLLALTFFALYCLLILAYGLGLFFACVAVFARDVAEVTNICLQMAFWFTPIVYLPSILPDWLSHLLWINPMTAITNVFQQCFILGGSPHWANLLYSFAIAHAFLCLGVWSLLAWRKDILDVI